eukprot:4703_1
MIEIDYDEKQQNESVPLQLALKYGFVTPWTSMTVVKSKQKQLVLEIEEKLDKERRRRESIKKAQETQKKLKGLQSEKSTVDNSNSSNHLFNARASRKHSTVTTLTDQCQKKDKHLFTGLNKINKYSNKQIIRKSFAETYENNNNNNDIIRTNSVNKKIDDIPETEHQPTVFKRVHTVMLAEQMQWFEDDYVKLEALGEPGTFGMAFKCYKKK